jgi:uncharacterized protein YabN with tetrapyrrole methylase and pyrophosphatase domain
MTPEARQAFEDAEVALYLVADPVAEGWLLELNPKARSLYDHYRLGVPRQDIYERMTETILDEVRSGADVCVAFYGHPGVFVYPSHAAIARARADGFSARMLPAISAEDCLFAELGVDPATTGCQSYEATRFLLSRRTADPTAALILWQVGAIGERIYSAEPPPANRLALLVEKLSSSYEASHEVTLYEASPYPFVDSLIRTLPLGQLADAVPTPLSTLYVPPVAPAPPDPEMARRLGL